MSEDDDLSVKRFAASSTRIRTRDGKLTTIKIRQAILFSIILNGKEITRSYFYPHFRYKFCLNGFIMCHIQFILIIEKHCINMKLLYFLSAKSYNGLASGRAQS